MVRGPEMHIGLPDLCLHDQGFPVHFAGFDNSTRTAAVYRRPFRAAGIVPERLDNFYHIFRNVDHCQE
jgi:hypothetical protein